MEELRKMHDIVSLESKKFSIAIKVNGIAYEIFDIIFHTKGDKSSAFLAVSLPDFYKTTGLVTKLVMPANKRKFAKLSLIPGGKVTSHIVKYTHWLDGNTHFSQDGKVYTSMRNVSDRLDQSIGHIFTITMKGFLAFRKRDESKKKADIKRMDLEFDAGAETPPSVKFVGYWYKKEVVHLTRPPEKNGAYVFLRAGKPVLNCWAISPPPDSLLSEYVLLLTGERIPAITRERGSRFSFMGGFDEKSVRDDISKDLHLLVSSYPARNFNGLLKKIGTIDLNPVFPKL